MRNLVIQPSFVHFFLIPNFHPNLAAKQHGTPNLLLSQAQNDKRANTITIPPMSPITSNSSMQVAGSLSSKGTYVLIVCDIFHVQVSIIIVRACEGKFSSKEPCFKIQNIEFLSFCKHPFGISKCFL